jgi:uncharacterized protein involved in response to NO
MISIWYKRFTSQPHQPFFINGIVLFIVFLLLLSAKYANIITLVGSLFKIHAYPMMYIILVQFFLGFLFVVFPKFLTQASVTGRRYMNIFFLYTLGSIVYISSLFLNESITQIAIIILLVANITSLLTLFNIYRKSIVKDKHDTTWILVAFFLGFLSNCLFFISTFDFSFAFALQKFSINLGFYLFIFALIFTISQRMIPFFTTGKVPGYKINKSRYLLEIGFALLGFKVISLSIDYPWISVLADFLLFCFFTYELLKWKLPIFRTTAIMWVLYLALLWIPIGFFISLIESISDLSKINFFFGQSPLHAIAVGYFVTVLIGFGTRVTLGHSGQIPTADKTTIAIFWSIQILVLLRIFAGISSNFGFDYAFWIAISAFLLSLILITWAWKYLLILMKGI